MNAIAEVESEAVEAVSQASSSSELRDLEIRFLGKQGSLTLLLRQIGSLPAEEKPTFGQKVNEAKARVQDAVDANAELLKKAEQSTRFESERIDVTMPGRPSAYGYEHILEATADQ